MHTIVRAKPPYYGKYPYKLEIDADVDQRKKRQTRLQFGMATEPKKTNHQKMLEYIAKNFKKGEYKIVNTSSYWKPVYFSTEQQVNDFLGSKYGKYTCYIYSPAEGYENASLDTAKKPGKNALWYGRYPFNISMSIFDNDQLQEALNWCNTNCFGHYRKSGYRGTVFFYFVNPVDAIGFKLTFSDQIIETRMQSNKVAKQLLKERIKEAKKDLKDFMEGETQ